MKLFLIILSLIGGFIIGVLLAAIPLAYDLYNGALAEGVSLQACERFRDECEQEREQLLTLIEGICEEVSSGSLASLKFSCDELSGVSGGLNLSPGR